MFPTICVEGSGILFLSFLLTTAPFAKLTIRLLLRWRMSEESDKGVASLDYPDQAVG